jgi:hypothetical protein
MLSKASYHASDGGTDDVIRFLFLDFCESGVPAVLHRFRFRSCQIAFSSIPDTQEIRRSCKAKISPYLLAGFEKSGGGTQTHTDSSPANGKLPEKKCFNARTVLSLQSRLLDMILVPQNERLLTLNHFSSPGSSGEFLLQPQFTGTIDDRWLVERLHLRMLATLLTWEGKCSGRRAKPARFGCHLPHTAIDHHRRQRPSVSWDALPDRLHPMSTHDPDAMVQRQEMLEHLKVLLTKLKPAERELLAPRYAAGLHSQQIADVLGKRPEAIRKQLSRLLQAFKEQYKHEY